MNALNVGPDLHFLTVDKVAMMVRLGMI